MSTPSISSVVIARLAATAARDVPDVLGLHGGVLGEVATYGQNGPVRGVRVRRSPEARLQLHLIVRFGARLDSVADEVRARVLTAMGQYAPQFAGATVDVHIADVQPHATTQAGGAENLPRGRSTPIPYGGEDTRLHRESSAWRP